MLHKAPLAFPIIGGRKIEHLYSNIGALEFSFTEEQIKELEPVTPFDLGFPRYLVVGLGFYNLWTCH
jgi:aryl-alcohol dehydrogenase-like predicted oxidoreductase